MMEIFYKMIDDGVSKKVACRSFFFFFFLQLDQLILEENLHKSLASASVSINSKLLTLKLLTK